MLISSALTDLGYIVLIQSCQVKNWNVQHMIVLPRAVPAWVDSHIVLWMMDEWCNTKVVFWTKIWKKVHILRETGIEPVDSRDGGQLI